MTEAELKERKWSWDQLALLVVVVATVWAAAYSTAAAKKSDDAVHTVTGAVVQVRDISACNTQVLNSALAALNQRSNFSTAASEANVELQKAQADLLRNSASGKDQSPEEGLQALRLYFNSLTEYIKKASASQDQAITTPYPDADAINRCMDRKAAARAAGKDSP